MLLSELEVERYRSVRQIPDDDPLELRGLDALVGKNNAGKTNTMSAVKFLLQEEDEKSEDEELFWQRETDEAVVVRGFFEVDEDDLDRLPDGKRANVEDKLIDRGEHAGEIGIQRRARYDGGVSTDVELLQLLPSDDRLCWESFEETWLEYWERQRDDHGTTKTTYRDNLENAFPGVAEQFSGSHSKKKKERGRRPTTTT